MAVVGSLILFLAGGGLTAWGVASRAGAGEELERERKELAAARSDLADATERLEEATDAAESALEDARAWAGLGKATVRGTKKVVDLNTRLVQTARDMREAFLAGRLFDANDLLDQLNDISHEAERVERELRDALLEVAGVGSN